MSKITTNPRLASIPRAAARLVGQAPEVASDRGIPLFLLVRQGPVKKLLDFDSAAIAAGAQFNAHLRAVVNNPRGRDVP